MQVARRGVLALGWVLAAALLGICVLRLTELLDTSWEIAAIGVGPLVLPLALPLGIGAIVRRRYLLTVASVAVLVCWSVWSGPDLWPFATPPAAVGPGLRIYDANVSQSNHDLREIGGEIVRDRPDVIVLEELTPPALGSLRSTGALRPYHWSVVHTRPGPGGMGLWSRLPAYGLATWGVGEGQVEVDGWVRPPRGVPVRVDGVHVYAPAFGPDQPATWKQQLTSVRTHLAAEPRPLVVAGDFNATWDMRPFQRIMGLGLSDAAVLEGHGWEMTWPRDQSFVVPYLRIDHVLVSRSLTVTSYSLGTGRGSDHRPVPSE
jgi:endonuclease/exonuclease/phosphatase (EEP) superfamily protein YafD